MVSMVGAFDVETEGVQVHQLWYTGPTQGWNRTRIMACSPRGRRSSQEYEAQHLDKMTESGRCPFIRC